MPLQELNERQYVFADIKLRLEVIDTLERWNKSNATVLYDNKFVALLLVDVFKTKKLKVSTLSELDERKIRFIRGSFPDYSFHFPVKAKFRIHIHYIYLFLFRSILDLFCKRVGSDPARASRFNSIVEHYCETLRKKKKMK